MADEATLYRTSEAYLYNLTAFAMWDTKQPYLELLARSLPPPARLLDYGCGIGADGLALIEAGYRVDFADFDNPSTRYLRWRLRRRGLQATIYDLDQSPPPPGYDLAFAFDVIEHVEDPHAFLDEMESRADHVLVNLLEEDAEDTSLHHSLPIAGIVTRAAERDLRAYRRYHEGRSHVLLYRTEPARGVAALRSRLRGRLGGWTVLHPK